MQKNHPTAKLGLALAVWAPRSFVIQLYFSNFITTKLAVLSSGLRDEALAQ